VDAATSPHEAVTRATDFSDERITTRHYWSAGTFPGVKVPIEGDDRLLAAEARLAVISPGFLTRVRDAAGRLAVRDLDGTDTGAAVEAVGELAVIDLDVPTESRIPAARLVKRTIKRLVAWYLDYFGRQVSAFGQAVANLGLALADRTQRLEAASTALRADIDRLAERVERLENNRSGPA
jgi:hypothetical protein